MSDEYIKKDDAINAVDRLCRWHEKDGSWLISTDVIVAIKKIQPADVVERKRGKWEKIDIKDYHAICSCCGVWSPIMGNYCPNCGSDMRGADDE